MANFRSALKAIAAADVIPEYHIALIEGPADDAAREQGKRERKPGNVTVFITPKPRLFGAEDGAEDASDEAEAALSAESPAESPAA